MPAEDLDPLVARRRLSRYLRKQREASHLSADQAAGRANISSYKLTRIESGQNTVSVNDLNALLDQYNVAQEERPTLVELANVSRKRTKAWWQEYRSDLSPGFLQYLALEAQAETLHNFEPYLVPGLLQTREYAHAVLEVLVPDSTDTQRDRIVDIRQQRQARLNSMATAAFVIDEAVLHRRAGDDGVMRRQIDKLKQSCNQSNIRLHIMPMRHGIYPHWNESFVLLQFKLDALPTVLFRESHNDDVLKESIVEDEPASYLTAFYRLQELAPATKSVELIEKALSELEVDTAP